MLTVRIIFDGFFHSRRQTVGVFYHGSTCRGCTAFYKLRKVSERIYLHVIQSFLLRDNMPENSSR